MLYDSSTISIYLMNFLTPQVDIVLRPKDDAPVVTLTSLNEVITRCRPNDTMTALLRRNEDGTFVIRISVTEGRVRHCASNLIEQLVSAV